MQNEDKQVIIQDSQPQESMEMLEESTIREIYRLSQLEPPVPIRDIARRLGIDRRSVRKYIRAHEAAKGGVPPGPLHPGRQAVLGSVDQAALKELFLDFDGRCVPMRRRIQPQFGIEPPSLRAVERYCRQWRYELGQRRKARDRYETRPGEYMQIDFGERDVVIAGETRRIHVFVAVLAYSRRIFAHVFDSEKAENWYAGIEMAFRHFGGVPKRVLSDNAKALVITPPTASEGAVFNPTYRKFCRYHNVQPEACYAYYPEMKGKVERAVGYVKHDFLEAGSEGFPSDEAMNEGLKRWLLEVSDARRIEGLDVRTPLERFDIERSFLKELLDIPSFNEFKELKRKTGVGALVRVDRQAYRLDMKHANLDVDVLAGPDHIYVSYKGNRIHVFKRNTDAEKPITYEPKVREPESCPASDVKKEEQSVGPAQASLDGWEAMAHLHASPRAVNAKPWGDDHVRA